MNLSVRTTRKPHLFAIRIWTKTKKNPSKWKIGSVHRIRYPLCMPWAWFRFRYSEWFFLIAFVFLPFHNIKMKTAVFVFLLKKKAKQNGFHSRSRHITIKRPRMDPSNGPLWSSHRNVFLSWFWFWFWLWFVG